MDQLYPKWHRELELFAHMKPLLILEGNVLDLRRYPCSGSLPVDELVPLPRYLHTYFLDHGWDNVVFYSNLVGFANPFDPMQLRRYAALTQTDMDKGVIPSEFKGNGADTAPGVIRRAMAQGEAATVTILEMASHYITSPDRMDQQDVNSLNMLMQAAASAKTVRTPMGKRPNLLILLVQKLNDLPAWFYLNNPACRTISLENPDREERMRLISGPTFPTFFDAMVWREDSPWYLEHPEEMQKLQEKVVALTEGMSYMELDALKGLSRRELAPIRDLPSVVDLYRYGIRSNPWESLSMQSLRHAREDLEKRVKGQGEALERSLDVVRRAVTGMNGISSSSTGKPKGVLFYAGPTGTGKTETAKALAEKLFGDESACIRFDMSEYGQSHSDQKLMGAPPGYVGYESGGQLTNAVKNNPFAILLFDEIEKAHASILDKFLQILEDGRMTDGQGNTVYFSECIIIFTSNLGIYVKDALGQRQPNVTMDMPYAEVSAKVRSAIEDYFKLELGRPELLNRIGENIVVFDYIRQEAGEAILSAQVSKIQKRMHELKNIDLKISEEAYRQLHDAALKDLSNGGRGIGNQVESLLINPLSRWLFDHEVLRDANVVIEAFETEARPPLIRCRIEGTESGEGGDLNG